MYREQNFTDVIIEYFPETVNREELQFLLTEDNAWESFVAEAKLSRQTTHCARNFIQILLGRSPQASFLLAGLLQGSEWSRGFRLGD